MILKLKAKLLMIFLLVGIVPIAGLTALLMLQASWAMRGMAAEQLRGAVAAKTTRIESLMANLDANLETFLASDEFDGLHRKLDLHMNRYVVADEPVDLDHYRYKSLLESHGAIGAEFAKSHGYDAFYVIAGPEDDKGHVLYGSDQGGDVGGMLAEAAASDPLKRAWSEVIQTRKPVFVDFNAYAPAEGKPRAFRAFPVVKNEELVAIAVVRITPEPLGAIMTQRAGMGESGETYILGADGFLRTDTRGAPERMGVDANYARGRPVDFPLAADVLAGQLEQSSYTDYLGRTVLSQARPLSIHGSTWYVVAQRNQSEALAALRSMTWGTLATTGVALLVIIVVAILVARGIAQPLARGVAFAESVQRGDFGERLRVQGRDEIAQLGHSLNSMADMLTTLIGDLRGLSERVAHGNLTQRIDHPFDGEYDYIRVALNRIVENTREMVLRIRESANTIASGSSQISTSAERTLAFSAATSTRAESVATATEEVLDNLNTTAAAAEEMSASVRDIARAARDGAGVATEANRRAEATSARMKELGQAATEITNVTDMIKDIASQTNLLALNATIEAASAGEAGKGFAVVAKEIKELANQSAKAAEDIALKIEGVQATTDVAVGAIQEITGVIATLERSTQEISESVEQQTRAANDVSQSAAHIATVTREIAENIQAVSGATQRNQENNQEINAAAGQLARVSHDLLASIERYRTDEAGSGTTATGEAPTIVTASTVPHADPGMEGEAGSAAPSAPLLSLGLYDEEDAQSA